MQTWDGTFMAILTRQRLFYRPLLIIERPRCKAQQKEEDHQAPCVSDKAPYYHVPRWGYWWVKGGASIKHLIITVQKRGGANNNKGSEIRINLFCKDAGTHQIEFPQSTLFTPHPCPTSSSVGAIGKWTWLNKITTLLRFLLAEGAEEW